jgi:hypothetical protein
MGACRGGCKDECGEWMSVGVDVREWMGVGVDIRMRVGNGWV